MGGGEHHNYWRYSGSFRIKLKGGVTKESVPRSSFVGIFGDEIRIIEGIAEKIRGGWIFSVKEDSFGWMDFEIEEIISNGKVIFDGRGSFLSSPGGDK